MFSKVECPAVLTFFLQIEGDVCREALGVGLPLSPMVDVSV